MGPTEQTRVGAHIKMLVKVKLLNVLKYLLRTALKRRVENINK